ncbi:hypothetical protein [Streptomyces sp. NPDC102264]
MTITSGGNAAGEQLGVRVVRQSAGEHVVQGAGADRAVRAKLR